MPFLSGYTLRKQITISHAQVDSDLTDFPLFVSISSDSDIGGECLANGHDVRFTSSDGTTLLKYERQSFAVSGGAATGTFWVKVPTVAGASDTAIYLYYGGGDESDGADPTNVWDSNFLAVYHLEESGNGTSGEYKDSTSNARHLTGGSGAFPSRSTGISSYGQTFDGTNDHMVGSAPTLNGSSAGTLELFFKTSTNQTNKYLASNPLVSTGNNGFDIHLNGTATIEGWMATTSGSTGINRSSLTYADSAWHQVAQTYGGGDYKLFFDGAQAGSTVSRTGTITTTTEFNIGRFGSGGVHVAADIDEVRVSNVARSAAWLKFTYYNLKSAGNELTFGSEESDVAPTPRVYLPWYLHWMPSEEFQEPAQEALAAAVEELFLEDGTNLLLEGVESYEQGILLEGSLNSVLGAVGSSVTVSQAANFLRSRQAQALVAVAVTEQAAAVRRGVALSSPSTVIHVSAGSGGLFGGQSPQSVSLLSDGGGHLIFNGNAGPSLTVSNTGSATLARQGLAAQSILMSLSPRSLRAAVANAAAALSLSEEAVAVRLFGSLSSPGVSVSFSAVPVQAKGGASSYLVQIPLSALSVRAGLVQSSFNLPVSLAAGAVGLWSGGSAQSVFVPVSTTASAARSGRFEPFVLLPLSAGAGRLVVGGSSAVIVLPSVVDGGVDVVDLVQGESLVDISVLLGSLGAFLRGGYSAQSVSLSSAAAAGRSGVGHSSPVISFPLAAGSVRQLKGESASTVEFTVYPSTVLAPVGGSDMSADVTAQASPVRLSAGGSALLSSLHSQTASVRLLAGDTVVDIVLPSIVGGGVEGGSLSQLFAFPNISIAVNPLGNLQAGGVSSQSIAVSSTGGGVGLRHGGSSPDVVLSIDGAGIGLRSVGSTMTGDLSLSALSGKMSTSPFAGGVNFSSVAEAIRSLRGSSGQDIAFTSSQVGSLLRSSGLSPSLSLSSAISAGARFGSGVSIGVDLAVIGGGLKLGRGLSPLSITITPIFTLVKDGVIVVSYSFSLNVARGFSEGLVVDRLSNESLIVPVGDSVVLIAARTSEGQATLMTDGDQDMTLG